MKAFWHRLLLFLRIRNEFDWAGPGLGPEVPHPYVQHSSLICCEHCGGGKSHSIHREPFNARRTCEVLGVVAGDPVAACIVRGYRVSDPLTPAAAAELSRLVGKELSGFPEPQAQFERPRYAEREHQ